MTLTLVLGGTRSGKSTHAERLAQRSGLPVRYVATAEATDTETADRIRAHAARRPEDWDTVEAGPRLAEALTDAGGRCVLLDGLGAWIAGALHRAGAFERSDPDVLDRVCAEVLAQVDEVARAADAVALAIIVAEQAGEGVLPPDAASRAWLDVLGEATQRLAAHAAHVELVVAGRALTIAASPSPVDVDVDALHRRRPARLAEFRAAHSARASRRALSRRARSDDRARRAARARPEGGRPDERRR
jgi:adenosyl cobinamide kinase/adenosyl cobinamide phosphate guanylyltransferase